MTDTTAPDSYAVPAPGVTVTSGDLQVGDLNVPTTDPFNGDCIALQVTKPVDLGQLSKEIQRRTKTEPQLAMRQNPSGEPASPAQPYILWIRPGTLNETVCQGVLDKHVPIAETGSGPAPTEPGALPVTTVSPDLTKNQQASVGKLQAGKQLNASESSDLLRAILGIPSA